jgi:DNA invertase Pin-like site-specific DNA recombinase
MLIGYARVSTVDQNLVLQRDALTAVGCERIFTDEGVSGGVTARRGLDAALAAANPGDILVVRKLDRLGRSLSHLVTLIAELGARGVNFRSLSDPIDTTSLGGRLVMHIMGALAEFERGLIVERTQAGIQAAKKRGVRLGRRPSLTIAQVELARALIGRGDTPRAVARTMRVGKSHALSCLEGHGRPIYPCRTCLAGSRRGGERPVSNKVSEAFWPSASGSVLTAERCSPLARP